jgi:hypothetical protein
MDRFEAEVEALQALSGVDPDQFPLKWIKWETLFRSPHKTRAPIGREENGDLGYAIDSTHDVGVVQFLCKDEGTSYPIQGDIADRGRRGAEQLDSTPKADSSPEHRGALSGVSKVFSERIEHSVAENPQPGRTITDREIPGNDMISLPRRHRRTARGTENPPRWPRTTSRSSAFSDNEYWNSHQPMKDCTLHPSDPTDTTLQDTRRTRA